MNWLDLALIVFLMLFVLGGRRKGLIKGLFEIVGLVAAIVIGGRFYSRLALYLRSQDILSLSEPVSEIVAFVAIFILVLLGFSILAHLLRVLIRIILLAWLDSLGGMVLGLAKGLLVASLVLTLLTYFPVIPKLNRALVESTIGRPVQQITPRLLGALKERYPYFERFRERLPKEIVLDWNESSVRVESGDNRGESNR